MAGLIPLLSLRRVAMSCLNSYRPTLDLVSTGDLFSPFNSRNVLQQSVQVRFKGHSKWQNIKHIKAANDLRIGRMCSKYAHLIGVAIRENKMEKNPEYNSALRRVIASARSEDVPKSTIENAIKKATTVAEQQEFTFEVLGPGRCAIIVEMLAKNQDIANADLKHKMKKIGGAFEKNLINMFDKKGIVTARAPEQNWTYDRAENDAIESGAEEVEQLEQNNSPDEDERPLFEFGCNPLDLASVKNSIAEQKYEVLSAGIYYIPKLYCHIENEKEASTAEALIKSFESCPGVTAVHHNVA